MSIYLELTLLFSALIIIGAGLTLALFGFDVSELKRRELDKKILMWAPIALVFILILYLGSYAELAALIAVLIFITYEYFVETKSVRSAFLDSYFAFLIIGFLHLALIKMFHQSDAMLLTIMIGTVLSDVCGFFFGNFFGYFKLPEYINNKKSWDGVLGQLAGAFLAVLILRVLVVSPPNLWLAVPIGLGSALGDLMNSRAKRIRGIRNWSNLIPGHGGFIDRFTSLAGSSLLTFYFLNLF